MDSSNKHALLLLKAGIAFAFLYPALSAFVDPSAWIGYVPAWIDQFIPREIFLLIFSPFEIVVALGILFWDNPLPSIVAGIMLISIVVFNSNELSVVFRDISIAITAFALAFLVRSK